MSSEDHSDGGFGFVPFQRWLRGPGGMTSTLSKKMLDPLLEWGLEDALEAAIEEVGCCDAADLLAAFGDEITLDPLLIDRLNTIEF